MEMIDDTLITPAPVRASHTLATPRSRVGFNLRSECTSPRCSSFGFWVWSPSYEIFPIAPLAHLPLSSYGVPFHLSKEVCILHEVCHFFLCFALSDADFELALECVGVAPHLLSLFTTYYLYIVAVSSRIYRVPHGFRLHLIHDEGTTSLVLSQCAVFSFRRAIPTKSPRCHSVSATHQLQQK